MGFIAVFSGLAATLNERLRGARPARRANVDSTAPRTARLPKGRPAPRPRPRAEDGRRTERTGPDGGNRTPPVSG